MELRLHWGGRFRTWLGRRFGGDAELGDRVWRRILHGLGAGALLYYVLPPRFFLVLSTQEVLLLAFAAIIVLEVLRLFAGLEMPTIRSYEEGRIASYTFYALALDVAILLFPFPIATVVVLGTAFVDPLIGELRLRPSRKWTYPGLPLLLYVALGTIALVAAFRWSWVPALAITLVCGAVGVAVERSKVVLIDDDIAMTLVPGVLFLGVVDLVPSFSTW